VVLEDVICANCGPRLYNRFDEDPDEHRHYFPFLCRTEFARTQGTCGCGGRVLVYTYQIEQRDMIYDGYYDVRFPDGEAIRVYDVRDTEIVAVQEVPS
jgi:hypothetical protein